MKVGMSVRFSLFWFCEMIFIFR